MTDRVECCINVSIYSLHHWDRVLLWRESWVEGPDTTSPARKSNLLPRQQIWGGEGRSPLGQSSGYKVNTQPSL